MAASADVQRVEIKQNGFPTRHNADHDGEHLGQSDVLDDVEEHDEVQNGLNQIATEMQVFRTLNLQSL